MNTPKNVRSEKDDLSGTIDVELWKSQIEIYVKVLQNDKGEFIYPFITSVKIVDLLRVLLLLSVKTVIPVTPLILCVIFLPIRPGSPTSQCLFSYSNSRIPSFSVFSVLTNLYKLIVK